MASHKDPNSLRKQAIGPGKYYTSKGQQHPMRPGKTAEDKRIGAWASKHERNARQAAYRETAVAKGRR